MIASKEISEDYYKDWGARYEKAAVQTDRDLQIGKLGEEIEKDLNLIGSTAIEDKLQDEVGKTIKDIKKAGVQIWVLTGDKVETAINIGFAC